MHGLARGILEHAAFLRFQRHNNRKEHGVPQCDVRIDFARF